MQKRIFSIEWPDEYGPTWMNSEFIKACMQGDSRVNPDVKLEITDVTIPPPEPQSTLGGHDF